MVSLTVALCWVFANGAVVGLTVGALAYVGDLP